MKLEQNDKSILFSNTEIPDVFFSEYLSAANGDYIKVYLYILFLSKYDKDIKLNDLSKKLALPLKIIQEALKYWEDIGALIKKHTGYVVVNLQEVELLKLYSPKLTSSPEDIKKNAKNQYRAKAIENINNQFFQGIMSPSWYSDIDMWFKKYNFDEQVMMALFTYCFQRSALSPNYVRAVASAWAAAAVHTFRDLEIYTQKADNLQKSYSAIQKKLGLKRCLTEYEQGYVKKWTVDYGYSLDIIEIALKKTVSKANISFDYLDKMITDWNTRDLKTSDDVQNYLVSAKALAQNKKDLEKKVKYNNFEQRSYTNFDSLYANKQT